MRVIKDSGRCVHALQVALRTRRVARVKGCRGYKGETNSSLGDGGSRGGVAQLYAVKQLI